jgi:WD40 repeat protein
MSLRQIYLNERSAALMSIGMAVAISSNQAVSTTALAQGHIGFSMNVRQEYDLATPGPAVAVTWSADGSALVAASNYGGVLTIWDRSGHLMKRIERPGEGPAVDGSIAFVEGPSQVVFPPPAGADNSVAFAVWDAETGKILRTENGPQPGRDYTLNRAEHFGALPDQGLLAVVTGGNSGSKYFDKNLIVYETRTWRVQFTAKVDTGVTSMCVFGKGRRLGLGGQSSGRVSVLDSATGATVNQFQAYEVSGYGDFGLTAIAGSPAGDLIMTGVDVVGLSGKYHDSAEQLAWEKSLDTVDAVRMFRVKDGSLFASFTKAMGPIRQAMWDPKGRYVAFIDNANGLFLWAPWNGTDHKKIEVPNLSLSFSISPDGDRIAVTTYHGVRVYSINQN